jgi:hypothetical protein
MAARAPQLSAARPADDVLASVLAAAERAPLVPLTDEESELLAEVEGHTVEWISYEKFLETAQPHDDAE